jgi:hypothetical protein
MNPSSVDVRHILEDYGDSSGMNVSFKDNLFIGREPAAPINCVTIYDTPGMPPWIGLGGETGYEYPSIQIRIRNTKYLAGWTLAEEIKTALHGLNQQTWNGTLYSVITCVNGPALLEWDDNGNSIIFMNFNLQRRPSA